MGVDTAPGELVKELRSEQLHESGRDHQVRLVSGTGLGEGLVPVCAAAVVSDPANERLDSGGLGAARGPGAVPVRADRDDPRPHRSTSARIDQVLQQRALARGQDKQARPHEATINALADLAVRDVQLSTGRAGVILAAGPSCLIGNVAVRRQ
jgi:hypothetical protein